MAKLINIKRLCLVFGFLMLASGLFSVSLSSAQIRKPASGPQQNSQPSIVPKLAAPRPAVKPTGQADLFVKSIKVKSPLQEGDKIQGFATIIIANQGAGASAACEVKIICGSVQSRGLATAFMEQMSRSQSVSIPGIQAGATAGIAWPQRTTETWPAGAFKITVEADSSKKVAESNEANNLGQAQFKVDEKVGVVRKGELDKGGMPLAPSETRAKPTDETSSGVGKRNITGVDFTAASNADTGMGKRAMTGVDFTVGPNNGTGKREIKGVDFTVGPNIGTGKREITGMDFTVGPSIGTGKREITGVNFTVKLPVNN